MSMISHNVCRNNIQSLATGGHQHLLSHLILRTGHREEDTMFRRSDILRSPYSSPQWTPSPLSLVLSLLQLSYVNISILLLVFPVPGFMTILIIHSFIFLFDDYFDF